ncbi:MAG: hypothetical protein ACRDQU_15850 [Pseudonocardiaceae bacterium]
MLLLNLLLLGFVSFVPLPTRLVAEHTVGADARTASLLYVRDITIRYLLGLAGYVAALLALAGPRLTELASPLLALMLALGPSMRPAFTPADTTGEPG